MHENIKGVPLSILCPTQIMRAYCKHQTNLGTPCHPKTDKKTNFLVIFKLEEILYPEWMFFWRRYEG